jgi:hypothetical protein
MSIESCLQDEAEHAARSIQSRIGELEREIQQKSSERAKLVDELNQARLAPQRLQKYPVVHGSSILCPYCWVVRGRLAALLHLEPGDGGEALRCNACLTELSLGATDSAAPEPSAE